ncbi:FAD-binding oxidoreductase [Plantactinospora sp. B24E8]|uniref:FAD-binding oxidoreductase n=1 Tax=Plantactinospora sp. B24E8 TaxID=3153567 RepID=UPI00325E8F34
MGEISARPDGGRSDAGRSDADGQVRRRLAAICGDGFARPAGAADEVAGTLARWVAAPATPAAVAEVVRLAGEYDLSVVARGAGTKLDWGAAPSRVDIVLDTGRLAGVWGHPTDDRLVEIGAGTPVRAAEAILARAGRRLPFDVPSTGATIGGMVAAGEGGPLQHLSGPPGDQLVGVGYVDATGRLGHAGTARRPTVPAERADPELTRLLCGSQGALGVLVSALLRVQPIPERRIWVSRPVWTPLEMHDLVRQVRAAGLTPTAIEVDLPAGEPARPVVPRRIGGFRGHPPPDHPAGSARRARPTGRGSGRLAVLIEGGAADVAQRVSRLSQLLGGDVRADDSPPHWWRRYPFQPDEIALRIEVPADDLHAAIYALRDAAGVPVPVRGSAGRGVVHAALPGSTRPEQVAAILTGVRAVLSARSGRCLVVAAPAPVRSTVDLWGEVPELPLLRRLKQRYDPARRLAPGRYPGGL